MANDTISRQAAIDALLKLVEARRTWINTDAARKEISGIDASMCAIHDLPSAERRGRWIPQEYMSEIDSFIYTEYKCSNCGEISKKKSNYCPNCGAFMRGAEE